MIDYVEDGGTSWTVLTTSGPHWPWIGRSGSHDESPLPSSGITQANSNSSKSNEKNTNYSSNFIVFCFVLAFAVSALASNWERLGKPFNPLLGETYELERPEFRAVCEQVR